MLAATVLLDAALLRLDGDGPSFNARGCMDLFSYASGSL
jgi:hypothetical protein